MIVTIKFWVKLDEESDELDELIELVIDLDSQTYDFYLPDGEALFGGSIESLHEVVDTIRGVMGWNWNT